MGQGHEPRSLRPRLIDVPGFGDQFMSNRSPHHHSTHHASRAANSRGVSAPESRANARDREELPGARQSSVAVASLAVSEGHRQQSPTVTRDGHAARRREVPLDSSRWQSRDRGFKPNQAAALRPTARHATGSDNGHGQPPSRSTPDSYPSHGAIQQPKCPIGRV